MSETKQCSVCKEEKLTTLFYSNKAKAAGRESACIECYKKKIKKYSSKDYNPAITSEQYSLERWADTVVDGVKYPYKISDCGRLLIVRTGKFAKAALDQRGYPQVVLTGANGEKKSRRIHVLVGAFFVDNPNGLPEVNHIDGNKFNPHFTNLEWNTSKQNKIHSVETGLWKPHEINPKNRKVIDTSSGVVFCSVTEAAKQTGIDLAALSCKLRGVTKNKTSLQYL